MSKDNKDLKKEISQLHKRLIELENTEAICELSKREMLDIAKFPSENPYPVLRVSKSGKILYSNKACNSLSDALSCKEGDVIPADWKRAISSSIKSGKNAIKETKSAGQVFSIFITPVKGGGYANLYGYDVTLLKQTENNLKEINNFNQKLISAIPFGMEIVDLEGNILFMNKNLEKVFGKESIGKKCWEMYKDDKKQCPACPLRDAVDYNNPRAIEVEHVLGGKTFSISHIGIEYEGSKAILEIFQDITERKRVEMLKDEFVSTVSHELRTPLAIVRESVSLIYARVPEEVISENEKIFDIAKRGVDRLARIINDILDYQKLFSGKAAFNMKKQDVNILIKEVREVMLPLAGEKGLKLSLILEESLPKVRFDSDRIMQVLMNLVNNGIKFTKKGEVTIETRKIPDGVRVSVKDTGIGIKKCDISKLFQSFTQISNIGNSENGGTGLGLAISKKIVDQHDGSMYVASKYGKGSTFSFILPAKKIRKRKK